MNSRNSNPVRSVHQLAKYFEAGLELIHVAVQRAYGYFHHYVIIANESDWKIALKIVQYTGGLSHFLTGSTAGEVEETFITLSQVEKEIRDGLYVITGSDYKTKATNFVEACSRYLMRLGERAYHLVYNNCEHLANYIMYGNPESKQIKNSDPLKKAAADTIDVAVNDGKSNIVKTAISRVGNDATSRYFIRKACEQVSKVASKEMILNTAEVAGTSDVARNIIKKTANNFNTLYSAKDMLCSETCCKVADKAGKSALNKTTLAYGGLTFAIETGFAFWQINNLRKLRNEGKIKDRDFKRETAKTVVTVPVASYLTVAGSAIGQTLCPVPVVGAFLGGLVGSFIGRIGASVVTGGIFDWWWK